MDLDTALHTALVDDDIKKHCHVNLNEDGDRFVGIKADSDNAMVYFPIGYQLPETDNEIRTDIKHLIQVLSEFTTSEDRLLAINKFAAPQSVDFPINAYKSVIEYYFSIGGKYYVEVDPTFKTSATGKQDWPRTKVITGPKTRWSYANVWDPKSINGGTPKYSVSLIIPKSDVATVKKIEAAIQAAYEEGESKLKGSSKSVPSLKVLKTPLRDGDLERPDDAAYADSYFINANSASAPGIVDADRQPILERSEVYSGVYGRASINFYAFNSNGNKGIACGLNNLQKIADGEPLGGKSRAEDDFETDDNDDFLS